MKTIILTTILAGILSIANLSAQESANVTLCNTEITTTGSVKEYVTYNKETSEIINKITYQYDAANNIQKRTLYKWDNNEGWKAAQKYEYTYNNKKQVASVVHTKWDKKMKNWSNKADQLNHIYNTDGELMAVNRIQVDTQTALIAQN